MTPSGIETATFWFVAQCLSQLRCNVKLEKIKSLSKNKGLYTKNSAALENFICGIQQCWYD
jgi:hypothetical protein